MPWQTSTPTLFHHAVNPQKRSDFAPIRCLLTDALAATQGQLLMFPGPFPLTRRSQPIWYTHICSSRGKKKIQNLTSIRSSFHCDAETRLHTCLDSDLLVRLLALVLWCRILLTHLSTAAAAAQGPLGYSREAILTLLVENATCILTERL